MIRIRTVIGKEHVLTLWSVDRWVSIYTYEGKTESIEAPTYFEAGQMHLQLCQSIVKRQQENEQNTRRV